MAQDTGLGGLLGGGDAGIGKVLKDLLGGAPTGDARLAAGETTGQATGQAAPKGAIPMPGSNPAGSTQGQPAGMPAKPPGVGQVSATGGFGDLLDRFRGAGLGDQVDSWVGKGQNKPIDAIQVTEALGPQQVHALAKRAGLPDAEVADGLAKTLPEVVNKVTPQGQIPDADALRGNLQKMLGGI